jgi:hypothetical protein
MRSVFVNGITALDQSAKTAGVAVISGASTVPGLSSAVLERYKNDFQWIKTLRYGISPGQPLNSISGNKKRYGWQDLYRQKYPVIGKRWMANCDVPDIDLFPSYYNI